jgi:hypothetical protein
MTSVPFSMTTRPKEQNIISLPFRSSLRIGKSGIWVVKFDRFGLFVLSQANNNILILLSIHIIFRFFKKGDPAFWSRIIFRNISAYCAISR